jgi:rod shape-determining protein MreD
MALLVAVAGGLVYTPWGAAALGFAAGLLQETLTGGFLGVGALSKGLTGLVWTRLWHHAVSDSPLLQLPLLAGLTVFDGAIFFCTSMLFSTPTSSWDAFFPCSGAAPVKHTFRAVSAHTVHRHSSQAEAPQALSRRRHASAVTFQAE